MKRRYQTLFLLALLIATAVYLSSLAPAAPSMPSAPPPALMDGCDQNGQVLDGEAEHTARGYPQRFKIYLPPCYADQPDARYPVFYFVPGRGSGPGAWFFAGANSIADQLILSNQLPPFIIVATENTDNDPQATGIYDDLLPYIEGQYRVLSERRYRAAAGASLGGIAAYRLGFQHPESFSSVGMFGSGAISGEEKQIRAWLEALPEDLDLRVFMDTGEADPLMLERARVMDSMLNEYSIPHVLHVGGGAHTMDYWVSNLEMYFLWAAEEWQ
jgi:enterochelin esterase-like enzyme